MLTFKRGKRRVNADFALQDLYKFYSTKYPNPVSKEVYKETLKKFHQEWFRLAVTQGIELNFPFRLGSLRIRKKKKKIKLDENGKIDRSNLPVHWKATKEMWEAKYPDKTPEEIALIPHTEKGLKYNYNDHTERYAFKYIWNKITCNIPNKSWYSFKPLRDYRRLINEEVNKNSELQYLYYE